MNRGLIFETTLEQIGGGLFLQLAAALREHYIRAYPNNPAWPATMVAQARWSMAS